MRVQYIRLLQLHIDIFVEPSRPSFLWSLHDVWDRKIGQIHVSV